MTLESVEHHRIFEQELALEIFAAAKPSERPVALLMGGQPGSGKSGLLTAAADYLTTTLDGPATQIVGDDLRDYHPDYQRLLLVHDRTAAAATDADAGRWVQMCLEHARHHRCSVVVEGTMRDPKVPLSTAAAFREAGYRVEAWVMAVDPLSSRLGILARYHQQRQAFGHGRFTVDAAHDAGVAGVLDSVDALQDARAVDRVVVATRGPGVLADLPGTARSPRVRDVITTERTRPWSPQEVDAFVDRAAQVGQSLPTDHDHAALLARLVTAARDRGRGYDRHAAARAAGVSFPAPVRDALGTGQPTLKAEPAAMDSVGRAKPRQHELKN